MTQPHTTRRPDPEPKSTEPQQHRPRLPGWARALLALVAFIAHMPFVLAMMYFVTPLSEALNSSDPLLRMEAEILVWLVPVSYTHLTLPTTPYV